MHVHRSGRGRPVVFLHAALLDSRSWEEVVKRAPEGVETWLVELPDHTHDEPEFDLPRTAAAVSKLLAEVPKDFRLVGHSFGAYLAARLLPRLRGRVERAVMIGGLASMPDEMAKGYLELADDLESGRVQMREAIHAAVEVGMGPRVAAPWRERLHSMVGSWPAAPVLRSLRRTASIAGAPADTPFDVPADVLHARDDATVPLSLAERLAALSTNGDLRVIDDGGHCLPITEPELCATLIFGPFTPA